MAELQSRIVPLIVDRDTFWERYFFRVHRLREELQTAEEAATEETAATDEGAAMDPAAEGTSAQSNPLSPDADSIASSGQANASAHSTPSRMSSATVERPAPIARQRACGAQRRKSQCHPHVPKPLKPVVGSASLSSSLSHRAARRRIRPASHRIARLVMEIVTDQARRCKPANTQSERLAPPAPPRGPLVLYICSIVLVSVDTSTIIDLRDTAEEDWRRIRRTALRAARRSPPSPAAASPPP